MAPNIATLLLLFAYGSCMEMRETVERMVMVRTMGSDLQPAATGYIYKKESNGPASVIKMGESEVIEHFSKLYGKPEAYKAPPLAPLSAGPLHTNEEDENKAASYATEETVKPVVENSDEHDDPIDGIAPQDYEKIFKEYTKQYGSGYKNDFSDYLHGLGHFDHGIYHEYGGGKDYDTKQYHDHGDKGQKRHRTKHHYEKGDAEDYNSEKHEDYSASKQGGHKEDNDNADVHGRHYAHQHGYNDDDDGHRAGRSKGETDDGYHKVHDEKEFKKDHDFYDGEGLEGDHHKYAEGHSSHGSEGGAHTEGDTHDSGHFKGSFGKGGYIEEESGDEHAGAHSSKKSRESHHHHDEKFGPKGGEYISKRYGYDVKH